MTRTIRIGEALQRVRRPVPVDATASYEEIGIRSFGRGFFAKTPIHGIDLGGKQIFEIHRGDLVLNIVFAWEGAVALATDEQDRRVASHRFPTYVANPNLCDSRYMLHFLTSDGGRALLERASPGSAGRNRTLNLKQFESFRIQLPAIEEQHRVADRVESIAAKVATLESLHSGHTRASSALSSAILQQLSKWAPGVALGEVLTPVRDEVPVELDGIYRTAGIYSFGRGLFARPPIVGSDTRYTTLFRLHEDQFVLSRLKGWEGAVAIVPPELDGLVVSQEYPTFDIDQRRADPAYLAWLCRWDRFWESLLTQSKGVGARRDRVHPDRLLAVQVPLPSLDEQRRLGVLGLKVLELRERADQSAAILRAFIPSVANAALQGNL